jgi:uncharacterized cupredoxin-like copper-binding protein
MQARIFRGNSSGRLLVVGGAAALLLAGCGSDSTSTTGSSTTPAPTTTSAAPTTGATTPAATSNGSATEVTVTETEFKLALSQDTFKAGDYVFTYKNAGKFPHNIALNGPGVNNEVTPPVTGGNSGELKVTLQPGTYELWCAVPTHKEKGMDTNITVT